MLDFCFHIDSLYNGFAVISIFEIKSGSACLGQSKYMILIYFMKGTSIRCFWLLDYVGANVELLNGLCFVQIWSVLAEILQKVISLENWPSLTRFALPFQARTLADDFFGQTFLLISLRRVKLKLPVRAQMIGIFLLYNNNECYK